MQVRTKRRLIWLLGGATLFAALVAGLIGYTTPGMRLNWDSIAALCGF